MRIRSITANFSLALLCSCIQSQDPSQPPATESSIQVTRQAEGYLFEEGVRPVMFYQLIAKSLNGEYGRSNYIHPLYGLDGEVLTEDFPEDHRHHRGIFWTWPQVLIGEVQGGDPWMAKSFSWDVQESRVLESRDGVRVRFHWKSPNFRDGQEAIAEETTIIRVHESEGSIQKIDFEIRLKPQHDDTRLGGSEDDKGYGGFSARIRMRKDLTFITASGPVTASRNAIEAGAWMDFSGTFGGTDAKSGFAILVHPTSIGFPQPWIIRALPMKSMQNAVWPGPGDPTPVAKGAEVVLRYRVVLHRGGSDKVPLADLWTEYQAFKPGSES